MPTTAVEVIERRKTPRFQTTFAAELASGTCLAAITIHDISTAGCGVEIATQDAAEADALGATGLLQMPAVDGASFGAVLPVILRNTRLVDGRLMYGLQFRHLLPDQARKLVEVIGSVTST